MIELPLKDKKILFYLIQNSRQSLKTLGKKVGISKESIHYRIKHLVENEIINEFSTIINFTKLGYSAMTTHYRFINVNPSIKKEILDYFVNNKNTFYVSLIDGTYDLQVDYFLGDPFEFESLMDYVREQFYPYLSFQSSKFFIRGDFYNFNFLLDKKENITNPVKWGWGGGFATIDELDFKILTELSKNSRMKTKDIAIKLNSTVNIVNYRIKKLERQDIIRGYSINVNWSKIGYRWFHLQIDLRDYSKKNQIYNFLRKNPYLIRSFKFLIFDVDLHFTFLLNNMQQLRDIIESITSKFPDSINDYHFYSAYNVLKHNFMVPSLMKDRNSIYNNYIN